MSIDYKATGLLTSELDAANVGSDLCEWCYWKEGPAKYVPPNVSTTIFIAENHASNPQPEGWVSYSLDDGTLVRFDWDDGAFYDTAVATTDPKNGQQIGIVDDQGSGQDPIFIFRIADPKTTLILDHPVKAERIMSSPRCDLYSDREIEDMIAGREEVTLKDALSVSNLQIRGKLWCIKNRVFLTKYSRATLLRELVKTAAESCGSGELKQLAEEYVEFNVKISAGDATPNEIGSHKARADRFYQEHPALNEEQQTTLLLIRALASDDFYTSWHNAVSSFVGSINDDRFEAKAQTVVAIVEGLLT